MLAAHLNECEEALNEHGQETECPVVTISACYNVRLDWRLPKVRKHLELAQVGVVLFAIVAVIAQPGLQARKISARVVSSTTTDEKRYSTSMKELRNRFNQDKSKVRLLMLLSPT